MSFGTKECNSVCHIRVYAHDIHISKSYLSQKRLDLRVGESLMGRHGVDQLGCRVQTVKHIQKSKHPNIPESHNRHDARACGAVEPMRYMPMRFYDGYIVLRIRHLIYLYIVSFYYISLPRSCWQYSRTRKTPSRFRPTAIA